MLNILHHRIMQAVIVIGCLAGCAFSTIYAYDNIAAFVQGVLWGISIIVWLRALQLRRTRLIRRLMTQALMALVAGVFRRAVQ